jgi:hypothetical protein
MQALGRTIVVTTTIIYSLLYCYSTGVIRRSPWGAHRSHRNPEGAPPSVLHTPNEEHFPFHHFSNRVSICYFKYVLKQVDRGLTHISEIL